MIKEIWRDIENYEGYYQVSNLGKKKSCSRQILRINGNVQNLTEKLLCPTLDKNGYFTVMLSKKTFKKRFFVHRLIAQAFINNEFNKCCVNHINGITVDNSLLNLEWVTSEENARHAYETHLINHETLLERGKLASETRKITTVQMNMQREVLNTFNSYREAEDITGINRGLISLCCSGKNKTAGGFKWKRAS